MSLECQKKNYKSHDDIPVKMQTWIKQAAFVNDIHLLTIHQINDLIMWSYVEEDKTVG